MAIGKITLFGMYKWMQDHGDDLFGLLTVPTGMDADKLEEVILFRGAEFGMLYGDPEFVKSMIGIWSDKHAHTFERWVKALAIDYNPLENYDRMEDWNDRSDRARTASRTGTNDRSATTESSQALTEDHTASESGTRSDTKATAGTTTESVNNNNDTQVDSAGAKTRQDDTQNTISAYDSSTMQNDTRSVVDGTESDSSSTKTKSAGSSSTDGSSSGTEHGESSDSRTSEDSSTHAGHTSTSDTMSGSDSTDEQEAESNRAIRSGRAHGNIGVTTSQQMLQAEWEVARLNIYEEAADMFLSEFCIYVY